MARAVVTMHCSAGLVTGCQPCAIAPKYPQANLYQIRRSTRWAVADGFQVSQQFIQIVARQRDVRLVANLVKRFRQSCIEIGDRGNLYSISRTTTTSCRLYGRTASTVSFASDIAAYGLLS